MNYCGIIKHPHSGNRLLYQVRGQQKIITDTGEEATKRGTKAFEKSQRELYGSLESRGVKTVKLSDDLMNQIRSTLESVIREQLKNMYDYDELVKGMSAFTVACKGGGNHEKVLAYI
jgi:hypothetical protein